jgi:F-box-like
MSVPSISQSNILGEDVLQMIFQHLDAKNLLKCEAVCRQWRNILLAGTPWRRFYHRNIGHSPQWRRTQKILKSNMRTLRTEQYRGFCKDLLQQARTIHRNLRRGHFTKLTYPVSSCCVTHISISDDYVAWDFYRLRNGQPFCNILCACVRKFLFLMMLLI